jgi:transcription initiation factor TFIIB
MIDLPKKCPECGATTIIHNRQKGEVTCSTCGYVIDDKGIDFGKEWQEYSEGEHSETMSRVGPPITPTKVDKGLGTTIGNQRDISRLGKNLRFKFMRMNRYQNQASVSIEKNLKIALIELKRLVSYLTLSSSIEKEAAEIYSQAAYKGISKGQPIERIVTAAIYAACRNNNCPRTLDEFAMASGIPKKEIGRAYRKLTRQLEMKMKSSDPIDYLARFAYSLKLSPATQSKAVEFLEKISKMHYQNGKGPMSLAAAAIYIAALMNAERRTQKEVADVCGITEVTIRNRYTDFLRILELDKEIKKTMEKKHKPVVF